MTLNYIYNMPSGRSDWPVNVESFTGRWYIERFNNNEPILWVEVTYTRWSPFRNKKITEFVRDSKLIEHWKSEIMECK